MQDISQDTAQQRGPEAARQMQPSPAQRTHCLSQHTLQCQESNVHLLVHNKHTKRFFNIIVSAPEVNVVTCDCTAPQFPRLTPKLDVSEPPLTLTVGAREQLALCSSGCRARRLIHQHLLLWKTRENSAYKVTTGAASIQPRPGQPPTRDGDRHPPPAPVPTADAAEPAPARQS